MFIQYLTVHFEFLLMQSKTKKCYIYTGVEKDGFFYPLHVAAEAGHKELVLMLVKAGAAVNMTDDRCHFHGHLYLLTGRVSIILISYHKRLYSRGKVQWCCATRLL